MEKFTDYGIEVPYRRNSGQVKCKCPQCSGTRTNKHDRSLSVNLDKGVWHCHYCNWSGSLNGYSQQQYLPKKEYVRPQEQPQSNYSDKLISYFISRGISEAVARKCKVSEGEEYMPQVGKNRNTIQFRYYLEDELINIKYRTGDKLFKLCKDAELMPYNINSIKDEETCIITEGEFDCLSFVEAGYSNCISVPNGANANLSYLDDFVEGWLDDKRTIYIATDTDSKGVELREELVRRLGAERCKIVTYGEGCKDANEHLVRYGKASLRACIANATDVPIEGVFTVRDFRDKYFTRFEKGLDRGFTLGLSNLDELVTWETKRLCIVTGYPSGGKSAFINDIVLRLNLLYGWKAVFFSPESFPMEDHAAVLTEWLIGKPFKTTHMSREEAEQAFNYLADNISMINPPDNNRLDYILERADVEIRRKGVKVVVLDPYNTIESEQGNKSETLYISEVLDKITNFARKRDVLFILAAHPSKPGTGKTVKDVPDLAQISGSIHFWNKADYGLVVHRFKGFDDENKNYTLIDVQKVKDKRLGVGGRCTFKYNISNRRYVEFDADNPSMLSRDSWDNRNYLKNDISAQIPVESMQIVESEMLQRINEFEQNLDGKIPF